MCDKGVSKNPFMLIYCPDRYKPQKICDQAVDDCLQHSVLFLVGLLQVKCLKSFMMLYKQIMIYSFLMKILIKAHFLLIK